MKHLHLVALAMIAMSCTTMAACATPAPDAAPEPSPQAVASAGKPALDPTTGLPEYRLDTGDQVKITVFNEPNLSGPFQVDGQGLISMSLIGEINAKGLTLRELQRAIETRLKDGWINSPQVSAEVTNYRPYYILGEVNKPGVYPYISGLTIMKAVATAGDFTYRAAKGKAYVKGASDTEEHQVEVTPSTPILPGDTIRFKERLF